MDTARRKAIEIIRNQGGVIRTRQALSHPPLPGDNDLPTLNCAFHSALIC